MANLAIIGAGHAGVEAATHLASAGHTVTLYTDESELPYFRPRLIAVAFGQAEPDGIRIKPAAFYDQAGITLRHEAVRTLTLATRAVNGVAYDGLVLAQGARPFVPPFPGEGAPRLRTLWTLEAARALRSTSAEGNRLTIVGGGVLGLEAALRAAQAGRRVTLIEVTPALANGVLGTEGEARLRAALEAKGITLHIGTAIASVNPHSITLADGTEIADDVALCSTGARPNTALGEAAGVPADCGLQTATDLAIAPRVYAAGDLARPTPARPACAVRRATAMGKLAAQNLLAELQGQSTAPWSNPRLPLFMKVDEVEFHTLGDVRATDVEERRIDDGSSPTVWQSVLYRAGKPVGLRFVGTRAGFADWEKQLA